MGVDYKGLMRGNHNPIDIARMVAKVYGGDNFAVRINDIAGRDQGFYYVTFRQRPTEEQMMLRPWERAKVLKDRQLAVFTDGDCACDYADLTTEPMTILSLGRWGDCEEIIRPLIEQFGGWIMDEAGDQEWHPVVAVLEAEPTCEPAAA